MPVEADEGNKLDFIAKTYARKGYKVLDIRLVDKENETFCSNFCSFDSHVFTDINSMTMFKFDNILRLVEQEMVAPIDVQ